MSRVSETIKEKRIALGMTQLELANKMGLGSHAIIANVEQGRFIPLKHIIPLAEALKLDTPTLVEQYMSDMRDKISQRVDLQTRDGVK